MPTTATTDAQWEGANAGILELAQAWIADQTFNDNVKVTLGTGGDADLYYDGTDVILNSAVVGSGGVKMFGGATPLFTIRGVGVGSSQIQFDTNSSNRWRVGVPSADTDYVWLQGSATEKLRLDSGGDLVMQATAKLRMDGNAAGDTYFHESAGNTLAAVVGGSTIMQLLTTTSRIRNCDLAVDATKKLHIDGGGDTYIIEASANQMDFYSGGARTLGVRGATRVEVLGADLEVDPTKKLYLDGGVDTAIWENSANVLRCQSGGSGGVDLTSGATAWAAVSDERLKTIIEPIGNAVERVGALRAVIGRYNSDDEDRRRSFLIAQDVQKVLPEAVVEGEDGFLSLKYSKTIPLLVAAIQELSGRVAELEAA